MTDIDRPLGAAHRLSRNTCIGIAVFALLVWALLARRFLAYTIDDAYIYFRYATNLAHGFGLVFNRGERPEEGITSLLYSVILAVAVRWDVDLTAFAKGVGLAASVLTSVCIGATSERLLRRYTALREGHVWLTATLGGAFFLTNPYVVANTVSGLETATAALAFSLFVYLAAVHLTGESKKSAAVVIAFACAAALVPLLRPEMGLSVVLILGLHAIAGGDVGRFARRVLLFFMLTAAAYIALRFRYYGLPAPLPFYIKQAVGALPGLTDLRQYATHESVLLASALMALAITARRTTSKVPIRLPLSLGTAAIAQLLYFSSIQHIMGYADRFFVPITTLVIALASLAGGLLWELAQRRSRRAAIRVAPFVIWVTLIVTGNASAYRPVYDSVIGWYSDGSDRFTAFGIALREAANGQPLRIALNDCGAIPFYSDLPTLDLGGLNNRAIALDGSTAVVTTQLRAFRPQIVLLAGAREHDPSSIRGWERLDHDDMVRLKYSLAGTFTAGRMPDGTGYHLLTYTDGSELAFAVIARLRATGLLKVPSARMSVLSPTQDANQKTS
jgi:arabinofuranosyltransferase